MWILDLSILLSICPAYIHVRLDMPSYLWFCCIYSNSWRITWCPKREETLEVYTTGAIGEVLVLGLLVVCKIPYSSCMFSLIQQLYWSQARCNWCVPIILLSIRYNVCACHSPVYHYITATAVYLIQRIIAACVVVMWSQSLYLSRVNGQRGRWACWKSTNTRRKSSLIWNT